MGEIETTHITEAGKLKHSQREGFIFCSCVQRCYHYWQRGTLNFCLGHALSTTTRAPSCEQLFFSVLLINGRFSAHLWFSQLNRSDTRWVSGVLVTMPSAARQQPSPLLSLPWLLRVTQYLDRWHRENLWQRNAVTCCVWIQWAKTCPKYVCECVYI